jgi:hypothetical protein
MHHDSALISHLGRSAAAQLLPDRSNSLALGEGAVLLVGLTLLNYLGLISFNDLPVHPFLFVVILLSAQYGLYGGILAAAGATVLAQVAGWPPRPIDMSYAAYFGFVWTDALTWIVAGLMVGAVTSNRTRAMQDQAARLGKATQAESLIAAQYQVLAQRTHQLERQLASHALAEGTPAPAQPKLRPKRIPREQPALTLHAPVHGQLS